MKGNHGEGAHLLCLCPCGPSLFPFLGEMQFIYVLTLLSALENRWGTEKCVTSELRAASEQQLTFSFWSWRVFPVANFVMWLPVCTESSKITIFFPPPSPRLC